MKCRFDVAADVAAFLQAKTGSVCGVWRGRMTAKKQRELFGVFFGKGELIVNGTTETIMHIIGACFGLDFIITNECRFHCVAGQRNHKTGQPLK